MGVTDMGYFAPPLGTSTNRAEIAKIKDRIDTRLNEYLCGMEPGYDDSITGFNEAWDIVHKIFEEVLNEK
jgi:hypothetical protein